MSLDSTAFREGAAAPESLRRSEALPQQGSGEMGFWRPKGPPLVLKEQMSCWFSA